MARAQFEYDEVGNTFYYVLVSFYAVVLFPLTYYIWPALPKHKVIVDKSGCQCEGCLKKRGRKDAVKPWERTKRIVKAVVLVILWIIFIILAYKVSQIEHEHTEYDPYKILGLDHGASVSEVKKKYHQLSKTYHPDRGGNAQEFDNIAKAYQALTDDEARDNWEKYGNPDGPKATTFGIALPKWIVSERYGVWVLAFYGFLFMLILPGAVWWWWSNSIKYSADKVLLETTRLYICFLQKTPSMDINRTIMVLAGSFEFWKRFNSEIVERESDDVEVPRLMKELRNLHENKKEPPFNHPWSIKARTLLHAFLSRVYITSKFLESGTKLSNFLKSFLDQEYMIGRSISLIEEFTRIMIQMIFGLPHQRAPTIETFENAIRLFPMFVQALWPKDSTLMQLPHLTDQNIPFLRRKRVISCADLANLNEYKRRALLNTITDEQYEDVVNVLMMMPRLEVDAENLVEGEDDKHSITIGSVVTVKVTLRRFPLLDPKKREQELAEGPKVVEKEEKDDEEPIQKKKPWEKQPKKKPKKGGKGGNKPPAKKRPTATISGEVEKLTEGSSSNHVSPKKEKSKKSEEKKPLLDEDSRSASDTENSEEEDYSNVESEKSGEDESVSDFEPDKNNDDDDEWDEEGIIKKENLLESEPTTHHPVHCPYYTKDKYEWWYLYLVDRKTRRLTSMVVPCKTLDKEKTVEIKFSAPPQKGVYYYILHVRSDSYMDCDYSQDIKIEVLPAKEVKYEDTENEDEEHAPSDASSQYTEDSGSDVDD